MDAEQPIPAAAVLEAALLNKHLAGLTPQQRIMLIQLAMDGYCDLCGKDIDGRACYCSAAFDD